MFSNLVVVEFWQHYASTKLAYVLLGVGLYVIVMSFFVRGRTKAYLLRTGVIDWLGLSALLSVAALVSWSVIQLNIGRDFSFFNLWLCATATLAPVIFAIFWRSKAVKGLPLSADALLVTICAAPILAIGVVFAIYGSQSLLPVWTSYLV